jgi:hypothetical protein
MIEITITEDFAAAGVVIGRDRGRAEPRGA